MIVKCVIIERFLERMNKRLTESLCFWFTVLLDSSVDLVCTVGSSYIISSRRNMTHAVVSVYRYSSANKVKLFLAGVKFLCIFLFENISLSCQDV